MGFIFLKWVYPFLMAQISKVPFLWVYMFLLLLRFFVIILRRFFVINKWSVVDVDSSIKKFFIL